MRPLLHPLLQQLRDGISEFTFANLYLFRRDHHYRVARLPDGLIILAGRDNDIPFFMSPFGLPEGDVLETLLQECGSMKCVSEPQAKELISLGLDVKEDRNNFDYLYLRNDLAKLAGRKFSKKRNLVKAFINTFPCEGRPLLEEHVSAALEILEQWHDGRDSPGDYGAAREALERMEELQLCGGIYYSEGRPIAYSLGEEIMQGTSFVIHFEKALAGYKGLWQFINQSFASILPGHYTYINREQDLGSDGLRAAKHSYKPVGFVKKFRATILTPPGHLP
jgi:hypothetical protein